MSLLQSKWLNVLIGDGAALGVYLSSNTLVMCAQQSQGAVKTIQHRVTGKGWAVAIAQAMEDMAEASWLDSTPLVSLALASEYFDSYVLSFQDMPNNKAAQQALIYWTLKKRKLVQDNADMEPGLRFQVMGKTSKGYKVLVEILHTDAVKQLQALNQSGCVLADTVCRASHYIYNYLQHSHITAPAALIYCEPDTLSGYYWNESGGLSLYRDHTLSSDNPASIDSVANDVISIIRRLEGGEWNKALATIFVAASSTVPAAGLTFIELLAGSLSDSLAGVEIKSLPPVVKIESVDPMLQVVWGDQS